MADLLLKNLEPLSESEESTALLGVVSGEQDSDATHTRSISDLVDTLQRENALLVEFQRVLLIEYTGTDADNRADEDNPNSLDFRKGATRHSFDDYDAISIVWRTTTTNEFINESYPIGMWNASSEVNPVPRERGDVNFDIWKASETSFRLSFTQSTTNYLKAIYGHRNVISVTTP